MHMGRFHYAFLGLGTNLSMYSDRRESLTWRNNLKRSLLNVNFAPYHDSRPTSLELGRGSSEMWMSLAIPNERLIWSGDYLRKSHGYPRFYQTTEGMHGHEVVDIACMEDVCDKW